MNKINCFCCGKEIQGDWGAIWTRSFENDKLYCSDCYNLKHPNDDLRMDTLENYLSTQYPTDIKICTTGNSIELHFFATKKKYVAKTLREAINKAIQDGVKIK
jgi:hypothetical protein